MTVFLFVQTCSLCQCSNLCFLQLPDTTQSQDSTRFILRKPLIEQIGISKYNPFQARPLQTWQTIINVWAGAVIAELIKTMCRRMPAHARVFDRLQFDQFGSSGPSVCQVRFSSSSIAPSTQVSRKKWYNTSCYQNIRLFSYQNRKKKRNYLLIFSLEQRTSLTLQVPKSQSHLCQENCLT